MRASNTSVPGRDLRRRLPSWRGWTAGRAVRPQLKAVVAAGLVLVLLFAGAAGYIGGSRYFARVPAPAASPQEPTAAADPDRFRLGSIVFVPWTGVESCEQRRFDNKTGQILFDGSVACTFEAPVENTDMRLRPSDEPVVDARARMRAIHESFKR